ncbi:hypothetical protein M1L60_02250 [Actinoplanes sp. TRM 88003]|uniref:Uncharacterized protein n=1 Tax=Paractinoplanes aksuensis TaxID=2939490 RepID=A0ABT1DF15_9ACTN|nr:hypothetical protein [Actinoplanes aksuensis]MCO8269408.1 hypothetical protein [Actinoplanes aksuensis]
MDWVRDNTWIYGLIAVAVVAVLAAVLSAVDWVHNRRRGRPWPVGARGMCRAGRHTVVERPAGTEAEPCRHENRCSTCDRVLSAGPMHDWGPPSVKDERCVQISRCHRCHAEGRAAAHSVRQVVVAELTPEELRHVTLPPRSSPCDVVEVCRDCGYHRPGMLPDHDFSGPSPQRCSRCGEVDDIGE